MNAQRQIGEALATALSGYTFAGPYASIDAAYRRRPDYTLEDLGTLKVSVVPGPYGMGTQFTIAGTLNASNTRGMHYVSTTFGIVLAKHIGSTEEIEDLEDLAQQVLDVIRSDLITLTGVPQGTVWSDFQQPVPFDPDALGDRSVWMTQLEITYAVPLVKVAPPAPGP